MQYLTPENFVFLTYPGLKAGVSEKVSRKELNAGPYV